MPKEPLTCSFTISPHPIASTNQYRNLLLLDNPGRVRSHITRVVFQIQRFDFDYNLQLYPSSIPIYTYPDTKFSIVYIHTHVCVPKFSTYIYFGVGHSRTHY